MISENSEVMRKGEPNLPGLDQRATDDAADRPDVRRFSARGSLQGFSTVSVDNFVDNVFDLECTSTGVSASPNRSKYVHFIKIIKYHIFTVFL